MGVTATLRPLWGIAFAALLALSLIATTSDALARTTNRPGGLPALFDEGYDDSAPFFFQPRPVGRLGITWE